MDAPGVGDEDGPPDGTGWALDAWSKLERFGADGAMHATGDHPSLGGRGWSDEAWLAVEAIGSEIDRLQRERMDRMTRDRSGGLR